MMEISQNVDMKELPTDEELMLSLAEELDKEVDKLSSPDIKSSVDLELQNGLELGDLDDSIGATKVIDSITKDLEDQNIEAIEDIGQEHDTDRDLVALLDTITSIEAVNEGIDNIDNQDANNAALDDTVAEIIGAVNEEAKVQEEEEKENDKSVLVAQDPEEDLEKREIDLQDKQIETEEAENDKELIEDNLTEENMVNFKENDNAVKTANSLDDPSEDKTKDSEKEKKEKPQNISNDEIFMDALENISSSDEFDAIDEENVKPDKSELMKSQQGSREDITSEESFDRDEEQTAEKSKIEEPIIDLDSTDEGAEDEKTKEQSAEIAETSEMGNPDKPKPVQVVETSEITEKQSEKDEEEKETFKETEEVALTSTQELEDDNQLEAVKSKEAEDKKAEEKKANEKKADEKKEEKENADENKSEENSAKEGKPIAIEVADVSKPKKAESIKAEPESNDAESEKAKPDSKDAESDDDEVIFFEPIEKSAKEKESKADKKVEEVVLLSEDEDEVPAVPAKQSQEKETKSKDKETLPEEKTTTATSAASESKEDGDLLVESSDNACDQFEKLKTPEKSKETPSEDGDSDSSNLLQPSQKSGEDVATEAEAEAETEADAEPEAETEAEVDAEMETDAEVETVAKPAEHEEEDEQDSPVLPAVKRIRLSTDAEPEPSSSTTAKAATTTSTSTTTSSSTSTSTVATSTNCDEPIAAPVATIAKRRNTLLSVEKDITPSKKPRTEDTDSNCSSDGNLQIDLDAHDQEPETDKSRVPAEAAALKPNDAPIELKPEPELKSDVKPLRLEFVKSFRKSFDKMSRQDLEELVLQKVVESMLVKSEFAEIRRLVDKHESTLATYRRKIAEVSKQFLDLETVHKRVLNDLKARNSQFTAPVRITRAVGLQVGMTLMKKPNDDARTSQAGPQAAGSMSAPSASAASNHLQKPTTSPLRLAVRSQPQRMPSGLQHAQEQQQRQQQLLYQQQQQQLLAQQQQQQQQQQQPQQRVFFPSATGTPNVRRGCVQKVTPQRPVNNSNGNVSPAQTSPHAGMQRMQTSPGSNARVYATKHTSPGARGRPPSAYTQAQKQQQLQQQKLQQQQLQQQQLQQQQLQQQLQQQQQPLPVRIGRSPGKPAANATNNAKQRPLPTVSVPMTDASSAAAAAGFGPQPNLAPARPKEKAVIDLTDEDDAAAAAAAAVAAGVDVGARLRQAPGGAVKRNMPNTPGAAARPVAGSVVRVSPMNMPRANAISRQIVSNNAAGQRNSLANVTMQIRSENTPPAGSRLRQQHPAPLPLAPPQKFHPEWKLPPSRPVIRISLHDSGIVISWTLEDTGSRFAECVTYQIYAYQETINEPTTDSWRHVGDVKAMLLPMAVTLNQFQENQRYFFAVRGVDAHDRYGVFSLPKTW